MGLLREFIDQIFMWLRELGYWGIMLGLMVEVIPSEIVLAYGGFLVSHGDIPFLGSDNKAVMFTGAVIFGTIGGTLAQIFVYWIGRYGGRPFLEKYGKYILINKKHIDISERWFERYGTGIIFTARFIPVVRHAISVPAGIARVSLLRFTIYTTLAVIPWSIFFIYLGYTLGENWRQIDEKAEPYIIPFIITAVGLTLLYFIKKMASGRKKQALSMREAGEKGEREAAHQLAFLGADYRVLHGRVVRAGNSVQEFDHIAVGPNGVFHIESKYWAGDVKFTASGVERSKEGAAAADPTAQLYRHEYVLKELLRKEKMKADINGILCFTHPESRISGRSPAFITVRTDRLLHAIKTYKPKSLLAKSQIDQIEKLLLANSKERDR
jgi:membrane protein DedA with SNARE-associated domain